MTFDNADNAENAEIARAAARRFLAREHAVLLRTIVRDDVAWAVIQEMWGIGNEGEPSPAVVEAVIEQIKAVRVDYAWNGEEPTCGAEPEQLLGEMGCKPCSLPAGHGGHRYPYPMPARPSATEA